MMTDEIDSIEDLYSEDSSSVGSYSLETFNQAFAPLSPLDRLHKLFDEVDEKELLFTSSFGSTSVILLHMLSKVRPGFPVHFVDTGYHFEETIAYRRQLGELFDLKLIDVAAEQRKHRFTSENETWRYNQDLCCFINKVSPVDALKKQYKVWISGLLRFQNANRQKMQIFQPVRDIIKFHPIIDMSQDEVALYRQLYDLPLHPLLEKGYDSIGCTHCTAKGSGRTGRWMNSSKSECGLHV